MPEPPDYAVLKSYLDFLVDTTDNLSIKHSHADEAVYSKILHIIWKHGDRYKKVIPLMGGFHQLLVLQKIIYKRHGCMGYKKWFTDAKIIAAGSIDKAIEGRNYYRCMRIHKEGFDAIVQNRVESLTNSYARMNLNLKTKLKELCNHPSDDLLDDIIEMEEYQHLKK